tara:strand:+ start:1413 stop:1586 length:174 start_codon:yes stop_codon:yes gene_type:complete
MTNQDKNEIFEYIHVSWLADGFSSFALRAVAIFLNILWIGGGLLVAFAMLAGILGIL